MTIQDFLFVLLKTVLLFFIAVVFILFPAIFKGYSYISVVYFCFAAIWWITGFYRVVNKYSNMFKK